MASEPVDETAEQDDTGPLIQELRRWRRALMDVQGKLDTVHRDVNPSALREAAEKGATLNKDTLRDLEGEVRQARRSAEALTRLHRPLTGGYIGILWGVFLLGFAVALTGNYWLGGGYQGLALNAVAGNKQACRAIGGDPYTFDETGTQVCIIRPEDRS